MQINDVIHGFKLIKQEYVKEISSEALEFHHEHSGARLLYIKNDAENKVFSISFRTPPNDDTGVPHIIEHSTLCGSRKFPLKEPFVELVKGSLNTFLNAMTYPDKTMYPVASCNDKDFQNLMDVYLDAVFYPAIYNTPEILQQEGWHYEIEKPEDPLTYSGVVYNEMKGALSSPEDLLETEIMRSLFPDNTYSKESGGNPEAIPNLTYEQFLEFHSKYYSPANSYIYLYGDMDIEEKLAFINEEYLKNFDKVEVDSHIQPQKPFSSLQRVLGEYPVEADENTSGKTFLSYNLVMAEAGDSETATAVGLLKEALFNTPAAPLRKALMEAGIGKDVSASFETAICQPYLSIVINGADSEDTEKFEQVLRRELSTLIENGIDRTILEASLNLLEFRSRESDFGSYPKGLIYNIMVMTNWLYDQEPTDALLYEEMLENLRAKLQTDYYEQLLKKLFLDNQFGSVVVMKPSVTLAESKEKALAEKLAAIKAGMTAEEVQQVIENTANLKKRQQTVDSPEALATIPLLKIEDIKPEVEPLPLEERDLHGVKVLYTNKDTHGIAYMNLYFDTDNLPLEMVPYLNVFTDLIGLVDTERSTYGEIANRVNLNTGGLGFSMVNFVDAEDADKIRPVFSATAKTFVKNMPILLDIIQEIVQETSFTNHKRIKELVVRNCANMELDMMNASVQVALSRLDSYISRSGVYKEMNSLSMYPILKNLAENFDQEVDTLCSKLTEILRTIFDPRNLTIGFTGDEEAYEKLVATMPGLLESLAAKQATESNKKYVYDLIPVPQQEALLSSSQVQYVAKGANFRKLGYEYTGSYSVVEMILKYEYFWIKIRVQGGAYGAMTRINRDGNLMFVSYRDPNLQGTMEVFDHTADYLQQFQATDREMTKYIIGTMSEMDRPLTPRLAGLNAQKSYFCGVTDAMRQQKRTQLLQTTVEDIRALAEPVGKCMSQNNLCVFGNGTLLKDNAQLFSKLTPIME